MSTWILLFSNVIVSLVTKVHCSYCSTDCLYCDRNQQTCTSCRDGYYPSGSGCEPCYGTCATCSSATICHTCKAGYYSPSSLCTSRCSSNCLDGLCEDDTGFCSNCPYGRYGHRCDFDCKLCKNEQCDLRHCTDGCQEGYWQYKIGDYTECRACVANCTSCNSSSTCTVCNDGNYLYISSETISYCLSCPSGCEKCSDINSCSVCKPGYFGVACQWKCSDFVPGCNKCNWDGGTTITCTQCDNGWTLVDNTCMNETQQRCPNNCESCTVDNVCEMCKAGWIGDQCKLICSDVIPHCDICVTTADSIGCSVCEAGYEPDAFECISSLTTSTTATTLWFINNTDFTQSTETTVSSTAPENVVPECVTQSLQPQNEDFQTSTFVVGFVTGVGAMALIGVVWFLVRRKRLSESSNTTRQSEHFYENNVRTVESGLSQDTPEQVNINTVELTEEHDYDPVNVDRGTTSDDVNTVNNEYTSLNVGQGEHIYKDLAAP